MEIQVVLKKRKKKPLTLTSFLGEKIKISENQADMPKILRKTEARKGKNKNREAGLDQKLRIVLSLIWPEIKNYEAEPIWGILIKKEGV